MKANNNAVDELKAVKQEIAEVKQEINEVKAQVKALEGKGKLNEEEKDELKQKRSIYDKLLANLDKLRGKEARLEERQQSLDAAEPLQKRMRSGEESLLKSHFGAKALELTTNGVLEYLCGLQRDPKLRERDVIHNEAELGLKLCGREAAERVMVDVFKIRHENLSKPSPPQDRTLYSMVVCSGMSGLGKTRMLEEWPRLFRLAEIPKPWLGVFVNYGNGHAPKGFENQMPIEAAFGWRMLHRLFVEENAKDDMARYWHERGFLPSNAGQLSLALALNVVRAGAERFRLVQAGATLSLFIGIDEYQKIPLGPDYNPHAQDQSEEREKTLLWKLIAALGDCRSVNGMHIYVGFAGTRWGPLSISGSSVAMTKRAPMTLLSPSMMENVIWADENLGNRLTSPEFRRQLFFLGGIPRPSVMFALGVEKFEGVWEYYVKRKWQNGERGLSSNELLVLIATAVCGMLVTAAEDSRIKDRKWGRLFDEGLCMLLESDQLGIPYCVFRLAASIDKSQLSLAAKCMVQVLQYMRDHVDNVLYDKEPWQLWETFSACFFALRVNSMILLGQTKCSFLKLCHGAVVKGCDFEVILCPMEVYAIHESIGLDLAETVTEKMHNKTLNWLRGSKDGIRYCLQNGTSGMGVDMFCALPLADDSGGLCLYNSQQKVVAAALGSVTASTLLEKANVLPRCLPLKSRCVRGLFSILASFNQDQEKLPDDSFVLSYRQHGQFHGTLASHPACKTWVDVNFDNVSTVRLLKSVAVIADTVVVHRQTKIFKSVKDFVQFCKDRGHEVSSEDELRVVAFGE